MANVNRTIRDCIGNRALDAEGTGQWRQDTADRVLSSEVVSLLCH